MIAAFRAKRDTRETRGGEKNKAPVTNLLLRLFRPPSPTDIYFLSLLIFVNIAWHNDHLVCFLNVSKI